MSDTREENRKRILSKNIQEYLAINKCEQKDVCRQTGIHRSTLSSWICEKSYPRELHLMKLAAFFKIRVSDLTEDHSADGTRRTYYMTIGKREIFDLYDTDSDFQWVIDSAVRAKREQKLEKIRKIIEETLE